MEYIYQWIVQPFLYIINYPITIFGFTFNLMAAIVFSFVLSIFVAIIRFFIGGKD